MKTHSALLEMSPDDQNAAIANQVESEYPILACGYESSEELYRIIALRDARFAELVNNPELWNF